MFYTLKKPTNNYRTCIKISPVYFYIPHTNKHEQQFGNIISVGEGRN